MNSTAVLVVAVVSLACSGIALITSLLIRKNFLRLTKGDSTKNIDQLLKDIVEHLKKSKESHSQLQALVERHEKDGQYHLRHVGLVRFNPFPDVGSDQSFTLALLDGHKNGFVISSLHARDKTRMFAKPVVGGKEERYQFSQEERLAVSRALHT